MKTMASDQTSLPRVQPAATHSSGVGQRAAWWARLGPLAALLLLSLLLLTLAYQWAGPFRVAAGQLDRRFIMDAHAVEVLPDIARAVRWTQPTTRLDLPVVAAHTPLLLSLTLLNSYPPGQPDPRVTLVLDGQAQARLVVPRSFSGPRTYHVLLPPQERAGWHLPLTLESTTITLADDPRPLGVALVEARLSASGEGLRWPPLWQATALLLCAAFSYSMLRGIGAGRGLAWGLALGLVAALALGLALWHAHVAPYTMRLAALAGLGALYGWAAAGLRRADGPLLATSSVVLLLGLAHWLGPLYQVVLTLDGAWGVTPYPPTALLAVATGWLVAMGCVVLSFAGALRHWRAWVLGVLAVAALAHLVVMIEFALGRSGPDFWILFKGAREWFRGGSMYDLVAIEENHFGHVFKVPPFYGMLFVPFAQRDGLEILLYHRITNIVLLALTLLLVLRGFGLRLVSALGAGTLLLFNLRPATDTIAFGQIDIVLLLLLVLALLAARRGWLALAGAAVALGTLFKLYPAALLALFVARRQWRALLGFAAALLLLNGIAVGLIGWEMHRVYLFEVLPRIGGGTAWLENQTLNGFASRFVAPTIESQKFDHPVVSALTYGGFVLAAAGATLLALRPFRPHDARFVLQYGLFALLMIVFIPTAWMHYATIALLPMFGLLLYSTQRGGLPLWQAALFGLAYGLIAYGNQWSYSVGTIMGGLTILGMSYKFYGLLLLLAVVVACLLDRPPGDVPGPWAALRAWFGRRGGAPG